ncbi:hypothetical protein B0H16DRAFT_1740742 [Mycena metata]|uniref:DUF7330 domain-containing protein n=1 Tax=Mycena metata TaxID=1033252 RepID=A0AAD7HCM2_9AGAR|nr:hypothetical protein B0H16DRAFT_1740742 [Mycena metata]
MSVEAASSTHLFFRWRHLDARLAFPVRGLGLGAEPFFLCAVDLEACAREEQRQLPDVGEPTTMIQRPRTPPEHTRTAAPATVSYYPYPLPFPQRRPASSTPVSPEARISAFPDHKFEPMTPLLRLPSTRGMGSSASGSGSSASGSSSSASPTSPSAAVQHPQKTTKPDQLRQCLSKDAPAECVFALASEWACRSVDQGRVRGEPVPRYSLAIAGAARTRRDGAEEPPLKVENGGIDVDVHLIGEPTASAVPIARTELHLELCGGAENSFPLIAKIHPPTLRRPPFRATLVSRNGFTSLHLPPSFHGLLTIYINTGNLNAHIGLSAALGAHATILSEDSTSRAYFIGALGMGKWEGDRAEVRVERGRVRVQFSGGGERDLDGLRRVGWEWMGV